MNTNNFGMIIDISSITTLDSGTQMSYSYMITNTQSESDILLKSDGNKPNQHNSLSTNHNTRWQGGSNSDTLVPMFATYFEVLGGLSDVDQAARLAEYERGRKEKGR